MTYTLDELKQKLFAEVLKVYSVFKDFFGEEHTDIQGLPSDDGLLMDISSTENVNVQGDIIYEISEATYLDFLSNYKPFILVWWPEVTVTNENNRSIVITDLYAKIELKMDGKIPYENIGFQLNRSSFSYDQFVSGYVHSHVQSVLSHNYRFQDPCLGRGPIRNTILDLKNGGDEIKWMMFCQELSQYVTVESLNGGPWIRMETVGSKSNIANRDYSLNGIPCRLDPVYYSSTDSRFDYFEFVKYYLKNGHLSFSYKDRYFCPGMPYFDFMIDISNAFIEWFNKTGDEEKRQLLFNKKVLKSVLVMNGLFYHYSNSDNINIEYYEGRSLGFTFKGELVHLHVDRRVEQEAQLTTILDHNTAMQILNCILRIINFHYKNDNNNREGGSEEASSAAHQTVCYI